MLQIIAPMGSPISGLMAVFKLRPLESKVFSTFKVVPLVWLRYVDDIFIHWRGNIDELMIFIQQLNELANNIKFTFELETGGKLPFLDVELQRKGNELIRSVDRKPIADLNVIPSDACTSMPYKLSTFRFLINRAFRISSDIKMADELEKIEQIASDNVYQIKLIKKLIQSSFDTSKNKNKTINEVNMKRVVAKYLTGFFE